MTEEPMRYISTRGQAPKASFADALLRGIAPDGGLYLPSAWPRLSAEDMAGAARRPYAGTARRVLELFDAGALPPGAIDAAVARYGDFHHAAVAPLVQLEPNLWMLELFWGPTAAFKDLAMQMMAPLADAALAARGERLLLLTATSGDTGAAAVRAFAGSERISLVVFHPEGRVSPVQRRQMTTVEADNVLNLAVRGDFDDCQGLVKALLADPALRARADVSSVNSINWGRLAGQVPYYVTAAAALGAAGRPVRFVVPTGNFGDAFAGWAARKLGAPVGDLVAAVNVNDALARVLHEGRYQRVRATPTASVSMDVQAPSNFERLVFEASGRDAELTRDLFARFASDGGVDIPQNLLSALRREVSAVSIDDDRTAVEIAHAWRAYGKVICPHTAVALAAARDLGPLDQPTVVLSTAHPAKFPEFVGEALGFPPPIPPAIRDMADRPERLSVIDASLDAARTAVVGLAGR
jgi:threonine synthase